VITQCPACATLFRLVPDQLRISEGWVRCGQCGEIFDASAHLQRDEPAAAPAPLPMDEVRETAPAPLEPTDENDTPPPSMEVDFLLEDLAAPALPSDSDASTLSEPASPAPDEADEAAIEPAAPPAPEALHAPAAEVDEPVAEAPGIEADRAEPDNVEPEKAEPAWYAEYKQGMEPASGIAASAESAQEAAPLESVSFVRAARRRAFWQSTGMRVVLSLLSLLLLLLLAAQVAVYERDRLVALQPRLKPLLQMLCRPSGCIIQPMRRIESIVIDSSSFTRLGPDAFRLAATVRNQSGMDLAMPWLELTLTDSGEQPLLRRVLSPTELGATGPVLAAQGEWAATLDLSLSGDAAGGRVVGYRVLAFYP